MVRYRGRILCCWGGYECDVYDSGMVGSLVGRTVGCWGEIWRMGEYWMVGMDRMVE